MNKLFFYVVLLCTFFSSYGQRKGSNQRQIDPSQIPSAVKTAQETAFPAMAITAWEVRNASSHFVSKYTAVFTQNNQTLRARYKGDGTLVSSSKYYSAEQAPSAIKNLGSKYNGYDLKSAEEIKIYLKAKTFYRAHFYKGKKKTVVYTDETGKEVNADKVPAEVKEDEEIDG